MKSVSILALAGTAAAAKYADFKIPYLTTHKPNGEKFNYYRIEFNVTSKNGDSPSTSWCSTWWGDDPVQTPVDQWLPCTTEYQGDELTGITWMVPQQLEVGDFYLALKQNFTETIDGVSSNIIATTAPYHFSNTTSDSLYNCTINPYDNGFNIHAGGDCSTTSPLDLPISDAYPACTHATTVSLSFPVRVATEYGESVYVVGSIPELGSWDLNRAVALNADSYHDGSLSDQSAHVWTGGDVQIAAGTTFEWKFVLLGRDGSWIWECEENRVATVDAFTCGEQVVGANPEWMRCVDH